MPRPAFTVAPRHARALARLMALALVLCAVVPAAASADRFVDPGAETFYSIGDEMVAFDGFVYFAANDGVVGNELWRTDGTAAGTTLVKDFYTGAADAHGNPSGFLVVGDRLYFNVSNDGVDTGHLVYYIEPGDPPRKTRNQDDTVAHATLLGSVNGRVLGRQLVNDNWNYGLFALPATGSKFIRISSVSTTSTASRLRP